MITALELEHGIELDLVTTQSHLAMEVTAKGTSWKVEDAMINVALRCMEVLLLGATGVHVNVITVL